MNLSDNAVVGNWWKQPCYFCRLFFLFLFPKKRGLFWGAVSAQEQRLCFTETQKKDGLFFMELKRMNTKTVVTCGLFVALGTVLSLIPIPSLPYGGSVTVFSMVPLVLLGLFYGPKIGLMAGLVYGLLQMLVGAVASQAFAGVEGWSVPAMAFLDYIAAYGVVGLSGLCRNVKKPVMAAGLGALVACLLRYLCHFVSGYILWGGYAEWFFSEKMGEAGGWFLSTFSGKGLAAVYSVVYNGLYMVPETVVTVIGCCAACAVPTLRAYFRKTESR